MKNIYFLLAAGLFFTSCGPTTVIQSDSYESAPPPVADVSYQSFYDDLSPYGNWINYPGYGYVWAPSAGPDFRPYATNGNWIYTDAGWTWASNYNWGWAPFHYGRWFYENSYGWMWIPGNEWAPAWVSWRGGGDYYGWAPMGPRVTAEMAMNNYNPPVNYWNFVPRRYMGNPGWQNYYVNQNQNITIINNTTIINNYSGTNRNRYAYAPGPDPNEVRRYTGNNFTPVQLRQANTPGARLNGSQYQIYQPRVSSTLANRGDAGGRPSTPAPARYESFNNMRPTNPGNNQPVNNTRPAVQPPANNQPVYNTRPSTQPPANNQPVYNTRPAVQPPVNNQPVNNPRPAVQPPANNQPVYNTRPVTQQPANNQPVNNPPVNNTRPSNQGIPTGRDLNEARANRGNLPTNTGNAQHPSTTQRTAQPNQAPPQNTMPQRTAPATPPQATGRPATDRNPNANAPVQRAPAPQNKPDQQPAERPKQRQADNN